MDKELLKEIIEKRKTYRDMIDFCCDNMIMGTLWDGVPANWKKIEEIEVN